MLTDAAPMIFLATQGAIESRNFYETVLKLKCNSEDDYAIVFDLNGTMLRIQKVQKVVKSGYTALGWVVKNIREIVRALVTAGVSMNRFPGLSQDVDGIWTSPSGAKIAWFADPDGNILSLTEL